MRSLVRLVIGMVLLLEGLAVTWAPDSGILSPQHAALFDNVPRGLWGPVEVVIGAMMLTLAVSDALVAATKVICYACGAVCAVWCWVALWPLFAHGQWNVVAVIAWGGLGALAVLTIPPPWLQRWMDRHLV